MGILMAKNKDRLFDDIEILSGKIQEPTAGCKHTLLVGKCQVKKNSKNPLLNHCVKIKGCPPREEGFFQACNELRIELSNDIKAELRNFLEVFLMPKYKDKPEFDEAFYRIQ